MGAMTASERLKLRRGEIAANQSKGLKPYKFKAGTTKFRILPAKTDDPTDPGKFERRYGQTYLKSFDNKNIGSIGDREITYGQADPIRDLLWAANREAGTKELKDHYYGMIAKPRIAFNALILTDSDQDPTTPVLVDVSESAFDGILAQAEVWADAQGKDIFSLADGHIFQVEKTGTGMDTSYTFTATPQPAPLNPAILEKLIDLDAWIQSKFEGAEQRCLEALQKLNAAAGLSFSPPAGLLGSSAAPAAVPQIAAPATPSVGAPPAAAPAMVTTVLDDGLPEHSAPAGTTNAAPVAAAPVAAPVIQDAVFEPVVEAAPVAAAPVAAAPAVAPVAAAPVAPVAPAAPAPAAAAGEPDLASILAALN
jgi:hypothetical protein